MGLAGSGALAGIGIAIYELNVSRTSTHECIMLSATKVHANTFFIRLSNVDGSAFEFRKLCFFCGEECIVEVDPRHPNRFDRKPGMLCRTADRGKTKDGIQRKSFKEVIEEVMHIVFMMMQNLEKEEGFHMIF